MVQAAHAAMEMGFNIDYEPSGPVHIVLLKVDTQVDLMEAMLELEERGFRYQEFSEPDLKGELTALCTYPLPRHINCLKKYELI